MRKEHKYNLITKWTGNKGPGTIDYRSYERSHIITIENKVDIAGTSDTAFNGDKTKHNPEELLVASISCCHMLWYLHLCSISSVVVLEYEDRATGTMQEDDDGAGWFTEVTLYPSVIVRDKMMIETANQLHARANKLCYIANSVKFPIYHKPACTSKNA